MLNTNWKIRIRADSVYQIQLANIVDEARSVPVLDNLHCPYSTPSIQGEALAPTWNSIWVDPFPNPHSTPGIKIDRKKWNVGMQLL